jgi:hypothetical protein
MAQATRICIDIETLPDMRDGARQEYINNVTPPGNYKKQETIDAWLAHNADSIGDKEWRRTALDGARGRVLCVGYAVDGEPVRCAHNASEVDVLASIAAVMDNARWATIIGHNVEFDTRFLAQRMWIHGMPLPAVLQDAVSNRYSKHVFCTMRAWAGWRDTISLANLSAAFGLAAKTDLDGSKVFDAWQAGDVDRICDYCKQDVDITRNIARRMGAYITEVE